MYDPITELEHYGIPGMRWGVRRTPAQLGHRQEKKLNRYKEKEIGKVQMRMDSIEARRKRYEKASNKRATSYKSKTNPTERQKKRYEKSKKRDSKYQKIFASDKKTARKEIEAIKKMSYKDMQKEKIMEGSIIAATAIGAFGSVSVARMAQFPVAVIPAVDMASLKTKSRLKQDKKK